MNKKTVRDVEVAGKRVLVRVDFNVALDGQRKIVDDSRLRASLDTIRYLLSQHARVVLLSHLGRPEGKPDPRFSLAPVAARLEQLLGQPVEFLPDCVGTDTAAFISHRLGEGEVCLLENVRFHKEEESNDPAFAKALADLAEVFVNDAFGTAHRAHASTEGVAHHRTAVAGLLMEKEIEHLGSLLESPARPFLAVLGGSKVSTKIGVIRNLLERVRVDHLLIGGGMSYGFLKALGHPVGDSLLDEKSVTLARELLRDGKPENLLLPDDVVVTDMDFDIQKPLPTGARVSIVRSDAIPNGWRGVDIGPQTVARYQGLIAGGKTIVWNGPLGVFEIEEFSRGTRAIAAAIADAHAVSVVGGGESVAAVHQAGVAGKMTWISTGGGASLEFLEGIDLPGVRVLENVDPSPVSVVPQQ